MSIKENQLAELAAQLTRTAPSCLSAKAPAAWRMTTAVP